jgi:hypothetical protein
LPSCNKFSAAKVRRFSGGGFLSMVLALVVILLGSPLVAQEGGTAKPVPPVHNTSRRPTPDDRIKVFAKNLELSEAQQAAVKKILEQRQQESLRIRLDPSLSGAARIARFRALQDITVQRIRSVLTEEQKKKYDPLAVRRIQPAPEQRSVEDWLKVTTPKN